MNQPAPFNDVLEAADELPLEDQEALRAARRLIKKRPTYASDIQLVLVLLEADAFNPRLKTHKLKGELEGSWACSVGYDLRIIFKIVEYQNAEAILLESIGTHDEVY